MTLTIEERRAYGHALRDSVPHDAHAAPARSVSSRDPIAFLEQQAALRQADLIALRPGRMAGSPFDFLRGAAMGMAYDVSVIPITGLRVQACGDAHIRNFGKLPPPSVT